MTLKRLCSFFLIAIAVFYSCSDDDMDTINYTEFDTILLEAKSAVDETREGEANGDLIIGSTAIFEAVIEKYEPYRETAVNQGTIDIATNSIKNALVTYQSSVVIIDSASLATTIIDAQALHDAAVEGIYPGEYNSGSKALLQTAIDTAEVVEANVDSTQDQINAAIAALLVATNAFEAAEVPALDFTNLNSEITTAQTLHDGAVEGTNIGEYGVGSKAILQTAIDVAQAIVNSTDAIAQAEIDAALVVLQQAVTDFGNTRIGGPDRDISSLTTEIQSAQSVHDAATEGTDFGTYAIGSKATLQSAINTAQGVADDLSTGQSIVDDALLALQAAVATFQDALLGINVLKFNGTDYIETTTFQGVIGGVKRTMEAWIKTDASAATGTLILSWGINAGAEKWDMRLNQGKLRIEYNGGGVNGTNIVNDGAWHHVAIVVPADNTDLSGTLLYLDGNLEVSTPSGSAIINTSGDNNFNIGRSASQIDRFFNGYISDVRIWNVGRTASEIADNKDSRLSGNETGLVGYWKLNDGSGSTVSDSGPSSHTGDVIGNPTWEKITSGLPFTE